MERGDILTDRKGRRYMVIDVSSARFGNSPERLNADMVEVGK